MSVSVAKVRPSLLIIAIALGGPGMVAVAFERTDSEPISAPAFPAFIDASRFADLAAAHKAMIERAALSLSPAAAEVRRRAEELTWGVHAPTEAQATTAVAEPADDKRAAWEAAARRAAEELAREQATPARAARTDKAAPPPKPTSPAVAKAPSKDAPAPKGEPTATGKTEGPASPKGGAAGPTPVAVTPAPVAAPATGKQPPPQGGTNVPAGPEKAPPANKTSGVFTPPSALGAVLQSVELPKVSKTQVLPTELGAFGWDKASN